MTDNHALRRFAQNNSAVAFPLAILFFMAAGSRGIAGNAHAAAPNLLPRAQKTLTGIDVLESQQFAPLRGRHIGLITNQSGVDSAGRRTIDVLAQAPGVQLVALFSPEHGIEGRADDRVMSGADPSTHLPVYSMYGGTMRPTDEMLTGIDTLVFDVQDAGVRFYTYITTMAYCLEEAARHHIAFFVLDRPNPLGGKILEGPVLDSDRLGFTGYFPMPVRYAMTMGELAQMFNAENHIGADLHVIAMRGWDRGNLFTDTGLPWIPPSPNLLTPRAAMLYPGIEILQAAGVSVGRGTAIPFEILGAPWIHSKDLFAELQRRRIPGMKFTAATFTPQAGLYQGVQCEGVRLRATRPRSLRSMRVGIEIASALWRMYPSEFNVDGLIILLGTRDTVDAICAEKPPGKIVKGWKPGLTKFATLRAKYLLYPAAH
jgi:uncharacterized protein YbbC (DUF1343 family)